MNFILNFLLNPKLQLVVALLTAINNAVESFISSGGGGMDEIEVHTLEVVDTAYDLLPKHIRKEYKKDDVKALLSSAFDLYEKIEKLFLNR